MKTVPVSVVIPVLNGERFIGEAIKSIQAQTLGVDEIIVVNNNSTDNSVKIAEELGAKVIHEKQQVLPIARNKGIGACRNDWIALLDCDDLWEIEKIEYQWKAIEKFPDARLITCDYDNFYENEKPESSIGKFKEPKLKKDADVIVDGIYYYTPKYIPDLCFWFVSNMSSLVCHRDVFTRAGLFDEAFSYADDMEFCYRALGRFPIATVKKNLANIRKHNQNMSRNQEKLLKYGIFAIEKMLKFPELYPPGIGKILLDSYKHSFVLNGAELASKSDYLNNSETT